LRDPLAASQNDAPRLRDDAKEYAVPATLTHSNMLKVHFFLNRNAFCLLAKSFLNILRKQNISHLPNGQIFHTAKPYFTRRSRISLKTRERFTCAAGAKSSENTQGVFT
jgi:hypothetical protein